MVAAIKRFLPKYLLALSVSPFLFTAGVFFPRHRFLIFQIARHFGMTMATENERLPVMALSNVLPNNLGMTLLEPLAEGGNVSMLEVMVIAALARDAEPATAFEIGTFDGRTTLNIAANLKERGKVWTLDLPKAGLGGTEFELAPGESAFVDKKESGAKYKGTVYSGQITQLYADSAIFDFSPFVEKMGLVFVDGSHAYEYVLRDSANALRIAAHGATILWHDYQQDWPGVIRALNELQQTKANYANLQRIEGTSLVMLKRESSRRSA